MHDKKGKLRASLSVLEQAPGLILSSNDGNVL